MNADLLTKPLPKGQVEKLRLALGMDVTSIASICQLSGSVEIYCNWKLTSLILCDLCTFIYCSGTLSIHVYVIHEVPYLFLH